MESPDTVFRAWEAWRRTAEDTDSESRAYDAYHILISPYVTRIQQAVRATFTAKGAISVSVTPNIAIDATLLHGNAWAWCVRAWWRDVENGLLVNVEGCEFGASPSDATDLVLTRLGEWRTAARVASARKRLNELEAERAKILAQLSADEFELVRVGEMVTP